MQDESRRGFLQWLAAGAMMLAGKPAWAQQTKPGTEKMLKAPGPIPPSDPLRRALESTTKENHLKVLSTAKLSPENKLAVAAAKELGQKELESASAKLRASKTLGSGDGYLCGGGCGGGGGSTGTICGAGCPSLLGKSQHVVDPDGVLKLNMKDLDKAAALKALDDAVLVGRQAAR